MARKSQLEPANERADALIGIATSLPIFRLVHLLNKQTLLQLVCEDDIPIYIEKQKQLIEFSFYYCENEDYRSSFCLVNNIYRTAVIIPSQKQLSYLLIIKGAIPSDKVSQLIAAIKLIPGVQLAVLLDQKGMKYFESVMEDLELHLDSVKMKNASNEKRIMPSAENQ